MHYKLLIVYLASSSDWFQESVKDELVESTIIPEYRNARGDNVWIFNKI
jgi:hypothetical protein